MHHTSLFCWAKHLSWLELLISPEHLQEKQMSFICKNLTFILINAFYLQRKLVFSIPTPCQAALVSLVHPGLSGRGLGLHLGMAGYIPRLWR